MRHFGTYGANLTTCGIGRDIRSYQSCQKCSNLVQIWKLGLKKNGNTMMKVLSDI